MVILLERPLPAQVPPSDLPVRSNITHIVRVDDDRLLPTFEAGDMLLVDREFDASVEDPEQMALLLNFCGNLEILTVKGALRTDRMKGGYFVAIVRGVYTSFGLRGI